jgi:1-acyl-sn-glycerol-3-phosphate acyltransferase
MPVLMTAWWRERGADERVYGLFHSFFLGLPGVGPAVAKAGALEAGHGNAEAVLNDGGIVLVYPGGDWEAYRPFWQRDKIDFAGRSGFIRLALRAGVPIVPAVSQGAQDTVFVLSRGERLARMMPHLRAWRLKVMPISIGPPWGLSFGLPTIPLPAQITVQLAPPIDWRGTYGAEAADDDKLVERLYHQVTTTMQGVMDDLVKEKSR